MFHKITIGITSYNAADTITAAVMCALAQQNPDFEIVIVDDCSIDDTWNIVQELVRAHPHKIRAFQNNKNLGVAGTRNRIISEAKGEFLAFFDDDDVSVPERIAKQMQRIIDYERDLACGEAVICHATRLQKYPDGSEVIAPTMGCFVGEIAPHGWDVAARILYNKKIDGGDGAMPTCSQMARIEIYRELGGFDETFRRMEDTEFNIRLALAQGHFVGLSEPLVIQKMTQAQDKNITAERNFSRQLYQKHKSFLFEQGRGTFDIDWVEAKHDYWEGTRLKFILRLFILFVSHPLLSVERIVHALPNIGYNVALRRFHAKAQK
jgi:glycosyltransferase involved in cell wall biosynthesis